MTREAVLSGGRTDQHWVVSSIVLTCDGRDYDFVQVEKNAHWFLKTVGGLGTQKGQLKSVGVIADLRKLAAPVENAEATPDAKAKPAEDEEDDPMRALNVGDGFGSSEKLEGDHRTKRQKRDESAKRGEACASTRPSALVKRVSMPRSPGSADTVDVWCYADRYRLWLRSDSLMWLLEYVAADVDRHGNTERPNDPDGVDAPAVAGKAWKTRWDANLQSYVSVWLVGPKKGEKVTSPVGNVDKARYDAMRQLNKYKNPWSRATASDKRDAAADFLQQHMEEAFAAFAACDA